MQAAVIRDFERITPPLKVIADIERLKPFETDAFISHRALPLCAVAELKRCSEWGGMHVRDGKIPRADIARF